MPAVPPVPPDLRTRFQKWDARGRPPQRPFEWKMENWRRYLGDNGVLSALANPIDRPAVTAWFRQIHDPNSALDAYIASYLWGYANTGFGPYRAARVIRLNTDPENGKDFGADCTPSPASPWNRAGWLHSSTSWTSAQAAGDSSSTGPGLRHQVHQLRHQSLPCRANHDDHGQHRRRMVCEALQGNRSPPAELAQRRQLPELHRLHRQVGGGSRHRTRAGRAAHLPRMTTHASGGVKRPVPPARRHPRAAALAISSISASNSWRRTSSAGRGTPACSARLPCAYRSLPVNDCVQHPSGGNDERVLGMVGLRQHGFLGHDAWPRVRRGPCRRHAGCAEVGRGRVQSLQRQPTRFEKFEGSLSTWLRASTGTAMYWPPPPA